MTWPKYKESWMPVLDRALGEVIQNWEGVVERRISWPSTSVDKEQRSTNGVSNFLGAVATRSKHPYKRELPFEAKGKKLYVQSKLLRKATRSENLDALAGC